MDEQRSCITAFKSTKEQEQKLADIINQRKNQKNCLMATMEDAQQIYGYLPVEVQKIIAEGLDVPFEKVSSVAKLYSQFSLQPKGKYEILICLGTACYVKGAGEILDKFCKILGINDGECTADGMFSITTSHCPGFCKLAPIVAVNGKIYGNFKVSDVEPLISKYRKI